MAQAGYTPIRIYASSTASAVPLAGNLSNTNGAELAINIADGKLFYKDNLGVVQLIASKTSTTNVSSISFGTTGLTPSGATTGAVTVAGTLAVANGGTGQTTYTDGQLLIGNSSGGTLTKATLTAGTGVSVTNGSGSITLANTGVTAITAGSGITISGATGNVTISAPSGGVTSITGTANQVIASASTGAITLSTPQSIGTSSSVQFGSFGVGTAASGTTGEIRATNNITAYYSSDRRLKENIRDIPDPVNKVIAVGGKLFDWTDDYIAKRGGEDGYFVCKQDFGVIAQDVQAVLPQAVRKRDDGMLAVDYEKLCALAFAAIKELTARVEALEAQK